MCVPMPKPIPTSVKKIGRCSSGDKSPQAAKSGLTFFDISPSLPACCDKFDGLFPAGIRVNKTDSHANTNKLNPYGLRSTDSHETVNYTYTQYKKKPKRRSHVM